MGEFCHAIHPDTGKCENVSALVMQIRVEDGFEGIGFCKSHIRRARDVLTILEDMNADEGIQPIP